MRPVAVSFLLVASLATAAFAQDVVNKTFQTLLKARKRADLRVELGAAKLRIGSTAPPRSLYKIDVAHDPEVEPKVSVEGDTVRLGMTGERTLRRGGRNDWDVHLSPAVVWRLALGLGASKGDLDLSGLKVRELDVEAGAAEVEIRWTRPNLSALERASVRGGAARFALRGLGYSRVRDLSVEGGAGTFDLDFSGPLQGKARVKIQTGAGIVDVDIPRDIGIRVVDRDIALAKVDWPDDLGQGDQPETPDYAKARGRIDLDVKAAIGRVRIRRI